MEIQHIIDRLRTFRAARSWDTYCTPKNILISVSIELGELLEHVQWQTDAEIEAYLSNEVKKEQFSEELADVLLYLFQLGDISGIDVQTALLNKIEKNERKYPVLHSKGKHTNKYT